MYVEKSDSYQDQQMFMYQALMSLSGKIPRVIRLVKLLIHLIRHSIQKIQIKRLINHWYSTAQLRENVKNGKRTSCVDKSILSQNNGFYSVVLNKCFRKGNYIKQTNRSFRIHTNMMWEVDFTCKSNRFHYRMIKPAYIYQRVLNPHFLDFWKKYNHKLYFFGLNRNDKF